MLLGDLFGSDLVLQPSYVSYLYRVCKESVSGIIIMALVMLILEGSASAEMNVLIQNWKRQLTAVNFLAKCLSL